MPRARVYCISAPIFSFLISLKGTQSPGSGRKGVICALVHFFPSEDIRTNFTSPTRPCSTLRHSRIFRGRGFPEYSTLLTIFLSQVPVFLSKIYTEVPQFCSAPSEQMIHKIEKMGEEVFFWVSPRPFSALLKKWGGKMRKEKSGKISLQDAKVTRTAASRSSAPPPRRTAGTLEWARVETGERLTEESSSEFYYSLGYPLSGFNKTSTLKHKHTRKQT